jgi:acetylornithine deacetylase/succinyl-diaminopimelate desuccinylase-like protein
MIALVMRFLLAALLIATPALALDTVPWRAAHEAQIVGQLDELVRLPSVAANPQGLAAAARYLTKQLQTRGFQTESWGMPALVYGRMDVGAKRTVVFYAHYDGQPVTPSEWSSDPFTPVMRENGRDLDWKAAHPPFNPEWRLHGRATADDKASIVAFLSAFDALKAVHKKPSVNIRVVWEGEEEAGSRHLTQTLKDHAGDLAADLWLIGDGPVHQSRTPTLYFGARGGGGVEATVYGPVKALHDGHYGNWAPNPAALAAELIMTLRAPDGRIAIPGFADDAKPLTAAERKAIADLPPIDEALKREFGIAGGESDEPLTLSTMRPALNIRGIRSGQVGAAAAGAIPVDAVVSMDFRLVPGEEPARIPQKVESFLRAKSWFIVNAPPDAATRAAHSHIVQLTWGLGYPGFRSDMSSPTAQAVIAAASRAAGRPVAVLPMMGASVPIYLFDAQFHVPVIGFPIGNHDNNQHAANENIRLQNLWDGIAVYAAMMGELKW